MSLHEDTVRFGHGDQHSGFFVFESRAKKPLPSVVVLQEAWGVDDHIEDVARSFARAGYAALAPDLFATDGKRPEPMSRERLAEFLSVVDSEPGHGLFDPSKRDQALAALPDGQRQRIAETLGALFANFGSTDRHLPALLASTKYLREESEVTRGRRVGSVGYCMGGTLSGLLAAHDPELAVACIYYGTSPSTDLVPRIACPVYGFYGAEDARITATVPPFSAAMKAAGKRFEEHTYPGAGHAFSNDRRPSYDVDASRDAFARVLDAFREHLV